MRLTAGLDSGPVALREETPIGPRTTSERSRRASPSSAASCSSGRSTCAPPGELEFTEQDESRATYAEKIDPGRAPPRPRPAGGRAERARAGPTPHVGAYLELDGGERLGRARRARPRTARCRPGELAADGGALLLGCGEGALRLEVVQPRGQARWRPTPTCAATRCRAPSER